MNHTHPLQAGLLLCDDVDISAQKLHGSYSEIFQNSLDVNCSKIKLTPIRCFEGASLPTPEDYQGYIISGSHCGVYEKLDWLPPLFEFVQSCWEKQIKIVGVCFGHQLLAHALGGTTTKADAGWGFGIHTTTVTYPQPWMVDIEQLNNNQYNLVVAHQDQVVKLGDKFSVIAQNDFCPNSMILAGNTMLGIQGHPEFSKEYCQYLANARQFLIGKQLFQNALNSLQSKRLDSPIILKWIYGFLKS